MALVYPQILYGWSVVAGVSDQIVGTDAGSGFTATLNPGQYYADTYAAEVQRAIKAATSNDANVTCSFNYSNVAQNGQKGNSFNSLCFQVTGTSTFSIVWSTNAQTQAVANQLGFDNSTTSSGATFYNSASAVGQGAGTAKSSASAWTLAEPVQMNTPITASAAGPGIVGSQALLLQRDIGVMQNVSDGGTVETVQTRNLRKFKVRFDQLLASEQTNFESWMNWAMVGQPFSWQPDKTSTGVAHFVLDLSRPQIANTYQWLTRSEATYGELTFLEQV